MKSVEYKKGAEGVGCGRPPQNNGFGTVAPYVGGISNKGGVIPVEELTGFGCMNSKVT